MDELAMNPQNRFPWSRVLIVPIILVAVVVCFVSLWRVDTSGDAGNRLPERFAYDLDAYKTTDPALLISTPRGEIPVPMNESRAVAVGPEDRIYVAGDRKIAVFNADGTPHSEIALEAEPRCLAVAGGGEFPGRIFVGMEDHVELFRPDGSRDAVWPSLGEKALLTSIALAESAGESDVFLADAGNRVVMRLDPSGQVIGRIGSRDPKLNTARFIVPSPYFDVAVAQDGLLRVANPGMHRIEAYTFDGDYEQPLTWGKASLEIAGFCGCCNPANFALLPDGRFVTAEKGIPRVKVYSAAGEFVGVVADPQTLAPTPTITEETREEHHLPVVDVAADGRGRVLVLDPAARRVRIFEIRETPETKS
jgi:hypothetical protein